LGGISSVKDVDVLLQKWCRQSIHQLAVKNPQLINDLAQNLEANVF
jgi:imidazole glycerol phosphate synthase subunit HisF